MSTDGIHRRRAGIIRVTTYNQLQTITKLAKTKSIQKRVAIFTLLFMMFQLLSPISFIQKQFAKASGTCNSVTLSNITSTSVQVQYNNSGCANHQASSAIRYHLASDINNNHITTIIKSSTNGTQIINNLTASSDYTIWTYGYPNPQFPTADPTPFTTLASTYTVTKSVTPTSSGTTQCKNADETVNSNCIYAAGAYAILEATAADGYELGYWEVDGVDYAQALRIGVVITADTVAVAHFYHNYGLELSIVGEGSITENLEARVSGETVYYTASPDNPSVAFAATPDPGYQFVKWCLSDSSYSCSESPYTATSLNVSLNASKTVTAYFVAVPVDHYLVTIEKAGTGSGAIACNHADCVYANGENATITATPASGSTFTSWDDTITCVPVEGVPNQCVITAVGDAHRLIATFTADVVSSHSLVVTKSGSGTVTGTYVRGGGAPTDIGVGGTYTLHHGDIVTLTATAGSGYTFAGWTVTGANACNGTGTCVATITSDVDVLATFSQNSASTYALTVNKSGTGSGTVTSSPDGINSGSLVHSFNKDVAVTLNAVAAAGSIFSGWTGSCSGTSACHVTMGATKSVGAVFNLYTAGDVSQPDTLIQKDGLGIMFNDALPNGATEVNFVITEIGVGAHPDSDDLTTRRIYDISATNQSDVAITTGFSATLTFPFADAGDAVESKYTVRYWNGTAWSTEGIVNIRVDTVNNVISFNTTHFSEYAIQQGAADAVSTTTTDTTDSIDTSSDQPDTLPETGSNILNLFANFLLAIGLFTLISISLKRTKFSYILS